MLPLSERLKLLNEHLSEMTSEQLENELGLSDKSDNDKLTLSDIYTIRQYVNLDEGFEDIAPELLNPSVNPVIWHHVSQLKFHRESLEKILDEEYNRLVDEELYSED